MAVDKDILRIVFVAKIFSCVVLCMNLNRCSNYFAWMYDDWTREPRRQALGSSGDKGKSTTHNIIVYYSRSLSWAVFVH